MIKRLVSSLVFYFRARPGGRQGLLSRSLRRFATSFNLVAAVLLTLIVSTAFFADLLASSTPLAARIGEDLYLLPFYTEPPALRDLDNHDILELIEQKEGWALLPPVPYGPNQTKVAGRIDCLAPPGKSHILGTDDAGRDVLSRMIHATRTALLVGLGSVALYLLVAVVLGALAGYYGGRADRIALRLIETFSSFPTFFLILGVQGLLGATSVTQLVLVIGLTRWTDVARLTRAEVLSLVHEDYVLAARALGLGHLRILARHILPGAVGPVFVAANFGVAGAILVESTLSFLGFGVPSTTPSWGQLLTDAFVNQGSYWLAVFPGLALFLTILSINLVGEGMREAFEGGR